MNGYVVLFVLAMLACGFCSYTAWNRERFVAIAHLGLVALFATFAAQAWGAVP